MPNEAIGCSFGDEDGRAEEVRRRPRDAGGQWGGAVLREVPARSSSTLGMTLGMLLGMTEGRDAEDQLLRPDHRS
jgi:hypothetical protein